MKLIPTTATTAEKIKTLAKSIKSAEGIPHLAALERASINAGYESWFHVQWCVKHPDTDDGSVADSAMDTKQKFIAEAKSYMDYLAKKGAAAEVNSYPVKGDVFHEVEIEGVCFRGAVGVDGPAIIRRSSRLRGYEQGWVQLGVAEIHNIPMYSPYKARAEQKTPTGHEWWVCKYGDSEERIKIDDLSTAGRHALAHEFGIVLHYPLKDSNSFDADEDATHFLSGEWMLFYLSPAFNSLCEWAKRHPRMANQYHGNSYLGNWATAARAGQYVFTDTKD